MARQVERGLRPFGAVSFDGAETVAPTRFNRRLCLYAGGRFTERSTGTLYILPNFVAYGTHIQTSEREPIIVCMVDTPRVRTGTWSQRPGALTLTCASDTDVDEDTPYEEQYATLSDGRIVIDESPGLGRVTLRVARAD